LGGKGQWKTFAEMDREKKSDNKNVRTREED